MPLRVEVGDSLTVTATDPSGITRVGFIVRDTAGTVLHGDSVTFAGGSTNVTQRFRLGLDTITTFPRVVVVEAFGVDAASPSNRGGSTITGVPEALARRRQGDAHGRGGPHISLPRASIGDAVYNPNRQELYLSNTVLDRIEVFSLASSSFVASIPVGSRPVGLALWPSDTHDAGQRRHAHRGQLGRDQPVDRGPRDAGREAALPAPELRHPEGQGAARPGDGQSCASPSRSTTTPTGRSTSRRSAARPDRGANCGDVIALYSTTPTPGQVGYPNRGYLAWENLTSAAVDGTKGHFFWEQAAASLVLTTDTLQVIAVRDSVPGVPVRSTILGAGVGQIVDFDLLQFQDSTFVRNSGQLPPGARG